MQLKICRIDGDVPLPSYYKEHDAAFDLSSRESYVLAPMEWRIFPTGLKMEIPQGFVGNIRDRSGMAAKFAVHTMAGVIDSGYRGEVGVVLINLSDKEFVIEKGMRIAQMLIQSVERPQIIESDDLSDTSRGDGGFGSSGF